MAINHDPIAFPKLDDAQIATLGKFATLKTFQVGETLFAAGERDFKFFVVKTGEVEIVDRSSGEGTIVTVHGSREFTGDVDMLTGRASVVSAIARTRCEAYEISAADLRRILTERPQLSDVLLRAFLMRRQLLEESGFTGLRVLGSRYSRDTHRIREFLARNKVPFTWIDLLSSSARCRTPHGCRMQSRLIAMDLLRRASRLRSHGRSAANHFCWRRVARASSPQGTCGLAPPSAWPLRWGKGRWRCSSCTNTSLPTDAYKVSHTVQPE
jgi:CRP-like cAMP-binding protein